LIVNSFDALVAKLRLPAVVAPMFLISGPELVIAAARAGIVGAFPTPNARTIEDLAVWLGRIDAALTAENRKLPWAINMIVHPTYDRFPAELELICRYRPDLVITALGSPRRALDAVHGYGGMVFSDVINAEQARKATDAGADGLILVASGAGGHTGAYSPFAFVEEVRTFWQGPLILGGAISSARTMKAAITLGADLAYMGTRFIACRESLVSDDNRNMLIASQMSDIVTSSAITGVPANWMRASLERAGLSGEDLRAAGKIDFSDIQGDSKAWKNIWGAGQGVGNVQSIQTVAEVVKELALGYSRL
jgi:nitronate monooxygenase